MRLAIYVLLAALLEASGSPVSRPAMLTGPYGRISSPNYPEEYGNDLRREWRIQVREGYHVKFRFTAFDLEDSYEEEQGPCVYDYVWVTEGAKTIGRFCGNIEEFPWDAPRTNEWFSSEGNETRVVFVSDYSNEGIRPTGFAAHYVETDNDECAEMRYKVQHTLEDWDELIVCDHFCHNIPGSYYCSCRSGYELHANRHICIAVAGCRDVTLISDEGVIQSPDYPNPYAKLTNCQWHIMVRDGLSVHIMFDPEFGVEEHDDEGCVYDILEVKNRGRSHTYCGTTAPRNSQLMDMNTRDVEISFKTDLSIEQKGFRIHYNTSRIRCLEKLTVPTNGSIVGWQRKDTTIGGNGSKSYYEFEDIVTFKCDRGYDLIGQDKLECLSNGNWNSIQPHCQIISCGSPRQLTNVSFSSIVDLDSKRFEFLEEVTVDCDDWYELTAGVDKWMCNDSKNWEPVSRAIAPNPPFDYPICRPKCGSRLEQEDAFGTQAAGGKRVKRQGAWPWMAFIDHGAGREGADFCGGTLVDEKTVITAAHCLAPINDDEAVTVWVGLLNRTNDADPFYTQNFTVPFSRRFLELTYVNSDGFSYDGDIAILKLDKPVKFSFYVHPICVPRAHKQDILINDYMRYNKKAVALGWGKTENGKVSDYLQRVKFPFVSNPTCELRFEEEMPAYPNIITQNMLCAGDDDGSKDTCEGDSGGPLMTEQDGKWYLSGIVSFGDKKNCGESRAYGVYTNVAKYVEFIQFHVEGK